MEAARAMPQASSFVRRNVANNVSLTAPGMYHISDLRLPEAVPGRFFSYMLQRWRWRRLASVA